jgi:uncharacterized membrane protein YqaE (UPF0057 family)
MNRRGGKACAAQAREPGPRRAGLNSAGTGNAARRHEGVCMDLLRIVISILVPPLGVFLQVGFGGAFWLNIVLTLLGYVPGLVHAIWIIARR